MEKFNKNNPTQGWTEDEIYDFGKMENKWLKELAKIKLGKRQVGVAGAANDPEFSSVGEINIAFENDILQRKENWKHICHICDYATNKKPRLRQHLAVHGIGERFKCDKCDKDFSRKAHLREHRKLHDPPVSHKCNQCGKMFNTEKGLREHQATHAEKHLKCDQCEKMFPTIGRLNSHKKQVHVLKSFKCDQCKYRTKTKTQLNTHIKGVHDGLRDISAKCDLCDFQGREGNLKHKESVHENKKNWFCKACPYSTYFKTKFQEHMRIHTGEKPYQCKICHKCFAQSGKGKAHCQK